MFDVWGSLRDSLQIEAKKEVSFVYQVRGTGCPSANSLQLYLRWAGDMALYEEHGLVKFTVPMEWLEDAKFLEHYTPCDDANILIGKQCGDVWRLVDDDGFFLTYIRDPLSNSDSTTSTTH